MNPFNHFLALGGVIFLIGVSLGVFVSLRLRRTRVQNASNVWRYNGSKSVLLGYIFLFLFMLFLLSSLTIHIFVLKIVVLSVGIILGLVSIPLILWGLSKHLPHD